MKRHQRILNSWVIIIFVSVLSTYKMKSDLIASAVSAYYFSLSLVPEKAFLKKKCDSDTYFKMLQLGFMNLLRGCCLPPHKKNPVIQIYPAKSRNGHSFFNETCPYSNEEKRMFLNCPAANQEDD